MRKTALFLIGILTCTSILISSCKTAQKTTYKYNGVYKFQKNGKEFSLINNKDSKINIDTIPVITPKDFDKVIMDDKTNSNDPILIIKLNETGKQKLATYTREYIGKQTAVILNDKLVLIFPIHVKDMNADIKVPHLDKKMMKELVKYFKKK